MRTETILAHADARIPRYTSYPTAPHFQAIDAPEILRRWLGALDAGTTTSLYLHVPFCREMCWYCGCHTKVSRRDAPIHRYLDTLEAEIDLVAGALSHRQPVVHLHWGGGTPSLVPPDRFEAIMGRLGGVFDIRPDAEIAMEIDPRTLDRDLVAAMARTGVTRASLGVQTFDAGVQRAINRVQPFRMVAEAAERLRAAGIAHLSADLLYGLPGQTVKNVTDTARHLLELDPARVSVFGYAHVPHMKAHQRMIDEAALPGARDRLAQADAIADVLQEAGYVAIGLDHFARPDDGMAVALSEGRLHRNFQGYTTDPAEALIGLGASAISQYPQGYLQNTPAMGNWERAIRAGRPAVARGHTLTPEDRMRRDIIMELMCTLQVDPDDVAESHGLPAPTVDLAELEAAGIMTRSGNSLRVRESYRPLARVVAAAFDARLGIGNARHAVAV